MKNANRDEDGDGNSRNFLTRTGAGMGSGDEDGISIYPFRTSPLPSLKMVDFAMLSVPKLGY